MIDQIRELDRDVKDKVKKVREVERKLTLLEDRYASLEEKLVARDKEIEALAEQRRQVINVLPIISITRHLFLSLVLALIKGESEARRTQL